MALPNWTCQDGIRAVRSNTVIVKGWLLS